MLTQAIALRGTGGPSLYYLYERTRAYARVSRTQLGASLTPRMAPAPAQKSIVPGVHPMVSLVITYATSLVA
jgi:hypothetical protein